jgi:hypothetical protein
MAKFVSRNAFIQVNGVDLSDHCSALSAEISTDDIDMTTFGPSGYREIAAGFKDANITATFFQDYAASSVHATLQPLADSGGTFAVYVKADKTLATSATNPRIELFTAKMFGYNPLSASVGDPSTFDTSFRNAGTAGVTYGTTGSP